MNFNLKRNKEIKNHDSKDTKLTMTQNQPKISLKEKAKIDKYFWETLNLKQSLFK